MIGSQIIDECYWRLQTFFDKENGSCRFGFFGYSKDFLNQCQVMYAFSELIRSSSGLLLRI